MTPHVPVLQVAITRLPQATFGQLEARTPRAAFTRRLARLCERIDSCAEVEVRFKPHFWRDEWQVARIRLKRLWAAGSYARGAATCGDLDLVFEYERPGRPPFPHDRDASIALFGSPPDFRFYAGTPDENSSHVPMAGACLVWSGPGCDWRKALSGIQEDPTAGPAPRKTSSLPLRDAQLGGAAELGFLESLIDARERGEIEWEFIPLDASLLAAIPPALPESLGAVQSFLEKSAGAKARALTPAIVRLLHARYAGSPARIHRLGSEIAYGNTIVRLGSVYVRPSCLLSHLALSEVMLVPHQTRRGPNGAWVVRRGPQHSLALALADARFWANAVKGEIHPLQDLWTDELPGERLIQLLEGFPSSQSARRFLSHVHHGGELAPRRLDGGELLVALAGAQRIEWDDRSLEAAFDDLRLTEPQSLGWELLAKLTGEARVTAVRAAFAASSRDPRTLQFTQSPSTVGNRGSGLQPSALTDAD